jgi:hypothetical protein
MLRLPIGISDFRMLREGGYAYIDKTYFIRDVARAEPQVLLFPRPRRFGKTLNMSMLRAYFEKSDVDAAPLFEGLFVSRESSADCRAHFQRYPVIFLSFKDVKAKNFSECFEQVRELFAEALRPHQDALMSLSFAMGERESLARLIDGSASQVEVASGLRTASQKLWRAYGEQVVILIDEYDTPIQAGFLNGYYNDAIGFFRSLLSGGLKDNEHLFKGVLTGILRVAKESIFSGLNNIAVYSFLRSEFATHFGFTTEEVESLAETLGQTEHLANVRAWYNGFSFGGREIYNPWSVLNFFSSADKAYRPYWSSTSSNDLLHQLLIEQGARIGGDVEQLLRGESIEKPIDEHTALRDLSLRPDSIWSLLLMSGYLKAEGFTSNDVDGTPIYRLSIPNREVDGVYRNVFSSWLERSTGGRADANAIVDALVAGDADTFEVLLEELVGRVLSYHDVGGRDVERVFQAFILGLLTIAEPRYEVRSNRESGRGRYDVMILPKKAGTPGTVLELKVVNTRRSETMDEALAAALKQIADKDYASELRARGANPVHSIAAVLEGKRVKAKKG